MSDEEIIKRRLLIDGDGTGEDRRINMLLKQFLKWDHGKNDTPENNEIVYNRLLAQLAQCEFTAAKNEYTATMIEEELKNYAKLSQTIEKQIEVAKQGIEDRKEELANAKQIRKNKMEYDALAKVIKEQPDREETIKQIETLKKELAELMEKNIKLDRKFDKRRKDFAVLMHAIYELQEQLDQESESDDGNSEKEEEKEIEVSPVIKTANPIVDDILSDDDEDDDGPTSTKSSKRRTNDRLGKAKKMKNDDDEVEVEVEAELMSVDEDAILELSIDKDEKEHVTDVNEQPMET